MPFPLHLRFLPALDVAGPPPNPITTGISSLIGLFLFKTVVDDPEEAEAREKELRPDGGFLRRNRNGEQGDKDEGEEQEVAAAEEDGNAV